MKSLQREFQKRGFEAVLRSTTNTSLREEPLRHPLLLIAAVIDNYLIKKTSWPSLVSLVRNTVRQSQAPNRADFIIYGWTNGQVDRSQLLSRHNVPTLIRIPDDSRFTGVCHYSGSCNNFVGGCHSCPAVRAVFQPLVVKAAEKKREDLLALSRCKFVAPSEWVAKRFRSSSVGRSLDCVVIQNPISDCFFSSPAKKESVSERKKIVFASSQVFDPIKGFESIVGEMSELAASGLLEFVVAGFADDKMTSRYPNVVFVGRKTSKQLAKLFSESWAVVVPSLQEAAGNVAAEALATGTIVLAREVGGLPETLSYSKGQHLWNQTSELVQLIIELRKSDVFANEIPARFAANCFRPEIAAEKYLNHLHGL